MSLLSITMAILLSMMFSAPLLIIVTIIGDSAEKFDFINMNVACLVTKMYC